MITRSPLAALAAFALSLTPLAAANAALPQGARAPDFTAQGALGGKPFSFNLRQALKRGPVVLYFYPKAFTQGCTLEAHAFADATADFAKAAPVALTVTPITDTQSFAPLAFQFAIAVGVRKEDTALRARLDHSLAHEHNTIRTLLQSYGVPLVSLRGLSND